MIITLHRELYYIIVASFVFPFYKRINFKDLTLLIQCHNTKDKRIDDHDHTFILLSLFDIFVSAKPTRRSMVTGLKSVKTKYKE